MSAAQAREQQANLNAKRYSRLAKQHLVNEQTAEQARLQVKVSKAISRPRKAH